MIIAFSATLDTQVTQRVIQQAKMLVCEIPVWSAGCKKYDENTGIFDLVIQIRIHSKDAPTV